ncbi:MAG: nicotinate (nicotinamide) nucleotide adenylyltransferase [Chloroflexi bacterium]|nr:nicotinate (nicotinamide) nucleotide adenylyltransferase [Chloroflexota bacterium]
MTERVGILGGTFDPPHLGHLVLAEYAAESLGLSRVLFVPAADPPHKRGIVRTSIDYRLPMLKLALGDRESFVVSRIDIDRPGPHYAVDMVRLLQESMPQSEFYFLMGSDSYSDLPNWNRPAELAAACKLAVMDRPGREWSLTMHDAIIPGLSSRVGVIHFPRLGISSTEVSRRVEEGLSVRYLVPDSVLDFIAQHGLYQHAKEQPSGTLP